MENYFTGFIVEYIE
jgi:hypothetical protein